MSSRVLVTGGSGFVALHCILKLLETGHHVRTTVRSLARERQVRATLRDAGASEPGDRLEFVEADLTADRGWDSAAAGCSQVLHVASPLPAGIPRHEDELVVPARDGALRVLRASRDAGVRRVVMTSSFAAVGYGHSTPKAVYSEDDWTDTTREIAAYTKSKAVAERAAWNFITREGNGLEFATVNPVVILGPVFGADISASIELVKHMLEGRIPALPRLAIGVVDVRDVTDLHIRAMTAPEANGHRFLCTAGDFVSLRDIALVLRAGLGGAGSRVTTRTLPDWAVRLGGLFNPLLRETARELGRPRNASSAKAQDMLGWRPRSAEDAILATGESLIRLGVVGSRTERS